MPDTQLAFDEFVLDGARRRLVRRDGRPVALPPRLFDALQYFVQRPGDLLDKETLMAALWPGAVVEENNLNQVVSSLRQLLGDSTKGSRYIQTVPRRGFRFVAEVGPVRAASAGASPPLPRLAVLPFKPLVADGRDELLEVGMADSLIARLSTLPGLAVLSVGSVRRFAGPDQDPLQAARVLAADWVVDGTLQRRGEQLRVVARLLRVADGAALWTSSLASQAGAVFEVQDALCSELGAAMARALGADPAVAAAGPEPGGTRSVEAYRWYLQGVSKMLLQRGSELRESIDAFRHAVVADPLYARAWVGLADAHRRAAFVGELAPRPAYAEVAAAVRQALAFVPGLGEAHATLAYQHLFDFDIDAAEAGFRRSLQLNPNLPLGHFGLGQLLLALRGSDAGLGHLARARELDPLQPLYGALEASFLHVAGQVAAAQQRLAQTLAMAPGMPLAHLVQAQAHLDAGDTEAGLAALQRAVALSGGAPIFQGLLGHYLARTGQAQAARAILQALQGRARAGYLPASTIALVLAGLGEGPAALDALELAWQQGDGRLLLIRDQPYWQALRHEPRFVQLLARMRLDNDTIGVYNP
ncbi:MAG: winged helix-turn-helix domain-containing protein [Burkholderiaceae bacterium]|nr:winged helix-turn-helix domain-containing protein [Burkholderiaceae bacterium]